MVGMSDFRKDKTGVAQTAANTAATLTAALVTAGVIDSVDGANEYFLDRYTSTFAELGPVVDADNELFASVQSAPKTKSSGGSRSGGSSSSGGGTVSASDARTVALTFGKFKGKDGAPGATLGEIEAMDKAATAEYGYETGDGITYITWLSKNENNDFIAKRALAILEDRAKAAA